MELKGKKYFYLLRKIRRVIRNEKKHPRREYEGYCKVARG